MCVLCAKHVAMMELFSELFSIVLHTLRAKTVILFPPSFYITVTHA